MKAATYAIALFTLITLTVGFSTVTLANDGGKKNPTTDLKYIGNQDNQPVFQLNLANAEDDEFTVTFRDEAGSILYTDKFKGANITRKFMLKSDEFGDATPACNGKVFEEQYHRSLRYQQKPRLMLKKQW